MSVSFVTGNMFEDDSQIRVCTVNCVGVMGKGVALAFKQRYPEKYKAACRVGSIRPGILQIYRPGEWDGDVASIKDWVVNFPTKRHWRDDSNYDDVQLGLVALCDFLRSLHEVRVSIPALGCGHGGLDWEIVKQMIEIELKDLVADIRVYSPQDSRTIA